MPGQTPSATGWALDDPAAALAAFLNTLPTLPHVLALGEPTHGIDAFPAWCNRLFHMLVREYGVRSIALESDAVAGLRVGAHVTAGQDSVDDVLLGGFSHGFGTRPAFRQLIEHLRAFNTGRDPADHLRFYGFDASTETMWAASPRTSVLALHAFLAEHFSVLPTDRTTLLRLCGDDARTLRELADELLTVLEAEAARLSADPDALWHARLHARTAQGLLRYHAVMADRAPQRVARLLTLRDLMMADNICAIAERERPRGPTLVFAHNGHLHRHLNHWRVGGERLEWCPAGVRLTERLGDGYAFIATAAGEGGGLPVPPPGTVEGWLSQLAPAPRLFATAALLPTVPATLTRRMDTASTPAYSPMTPDHLRRTDGLLFLPTVGTGPEAVRL